MTPTTIGCTSDAVGLTVNCRQSRALSSAAEKSGREAIKDPLRGIARASQGGGGNAIRIFSHFPHFFSHFLGRSLSVMFKRIHSSGIV